MAKKKHLPACSCTIKQLPQKQLMTAAKFACSVNPANAVMMPDDAAAIAVLTQKYWGPSGVHLTVGFLSPASAALQEKIIAHMNAWSKWCNATFTIVQGAAKTADVRIGLGAGGYWSYLGTDVANIPSTQPTMNLQGFSLQTPESEYARVIRHETGHTLGCPHEHMRSAIINRLDYAKTVAYMQQTQGWSEQTTRNQVFTPISEASVMATPTADEDSIMTYWFPATCTKNGAPIVGGKDITARDGTFMGTVYPLAVTPPPVPPASGKFRVTLEVDAATKSITVVP